MYVHCYTHSHWKPVFHVQHPRLVVTETSSVSSTTSTYAVLWTNLLAMCGGTLCPVMSYLSTQVRRLWLKWVCLSQIIFFIYAILFFSFAAALPVQSKLSLHFTSAVFLDYCGHKVSKALNSKNFNCSVQAALSIYRNSGSIPCILRPCIILLTFSS